LTAVLLYTADSRRFDIVSAERRRYGGLLEVADPERFVEEVRRD
jgi:hypothetical protein